MRVSSQPDRSNPYLSVPIPSSYMPHELLHNYYNSGHLTAWERVSIDKRNYKTMGEYKFHGIQSVQNKQKIIQFTMQIAQSKR